MSFMTQLWRSHSIFSAISLGYTSQHYSRWEGLHRGMPIGEPIGGYFAVSLTHLYSIGYPCRLHFQNFHPPDLSLNDYTDFSSLLSQAIFMLTIHLPYSFRLIKDIVYFSALVYKCPFGRCRCLLFRHTTGKENQNFFDERGLKRSVQTCSCILP